MMALINLKTPDVICEKTESVSKGNSMFYPFSSNMYWQVVADTQKDEAAPGFNQQIKSLDRMRKV